MAVLEEHSMVGCHCFRALRCIPLSHDYPGAHFSPFYYALHLHINPEINTVTPEHGTHF